MMSKALTYTTILMTSFYTPMGSRKTHTISHLFDLQPFTIKEKENVLVVTFTKPFIAKEKLPESLDALWFVMTDDAGIRWAGDWRDLGCFGLRFRFDGGVKILSFDPFTFEAKKEKDNIRYYERNYIVPDRYYGETYNEIRSIYSTRRPI